jgi:hypothetical protein
MALVTTVGQEEPLLEDWAAQEFGAVALGDARRTARLVQLAGVLGARPTASLPDACADPALLKAAYRFFDSAAVTPEALLAGHVRATYRRLAAVPLVLAVQDATLLDWTHHPATEGLGPLGGPRQRGLLAHSTLALTPERVPLGLLAQEVWAREPPPDPPPDPPARPAAEKESHKWLTSLAAVEAARAACPATHFVSVGDREADVYELFALPRPAGVDLLVRAAWDRRVEHAEKDLWAAAVAAAPVAATVELRVPPRGTRPARQATLTVRWRAVTVRPPKRRTEAGERLPDVALWAVWAVGETPPRDTPAVEWLLLTTVPVGDTNGALERLAWYACRWGIEVWHKILKSGCRIEARQLATAERLRRGLALYSVIAWRVLWAAMLARAVPDAPCTALLEEAEWQALYCAIHRTPPPPAQPPPLRAAVHWLARLGGFQGRAGDGEPGVTVLWKGFQHLADLTTMYRIMRPTPHNVGKD